MADQANHRFSSVWVLALIFAIGAAVYIGLSITKRKIIQGHSQSQLRILGSVPDFALTERSGRTITRADLSGNVWVADFVFTRCPGPCPVMTAQLAELQKSLQPSDPVRLVSFSVDPEHDTPAVLTEYAGRFGARERWWFLTGDKEAIYALVTQGFHLGVQENPAETRLPSEGPILHSTRFVLVDRRGQIRGYYDSSAGDTLSRLLRDIGILLRETHA